MKQWYGVRTVGVHCPPFRRLTQTENRDVSRRIEAAAPDIVWVGLSTPKQERWMYEQRPRAKVSVLVGVGAAFDFIAGKVKQAPGWMHKTGWSGAFASFRSPGVYGDAILS